MHDANADRRRQAKLYRRLATIPTEGGHQADRALLRLADRLERVANKLEEGTNPAFHESQKGPSWGRR
jgi:hypothetical protein